MAYNGESRGGARHSTIGERSDIEDEGKLVLHCLSPDTMVRTTNGHKATRDIAIGDKLFNQLDMPVICKSVGSIIKSDTMRTVTYKEWNSHKDTNFDCTTDHVMSMQAYGVAPTIKLECVVVWYTRCDRTELIEEVKDLEWEALMHRFYTDASEKFGRRPTDDEAKEYINSLVDEWSAASTDPNGVLHPVFKHFMDTIPVDDLVDLEEDSLEPTFRAALLEYMEEYLEHLVPEQAEVPDDEDDLEIDLDDSRPRKFRLLPQLPSSTHASDPPFPQTTAVPSSPPHGQKNLSSDGTSFVDTDEIIPPEDEEHMDKFAAVRDSISSKCTHKPGPCKAFKKYQVRFKNASQAKLAQELLSGEHYRVVDPFAVQNGDTWTITLDEYLASCANVDNKANRKLKLYRAPLQFVASEVPATSVPVDPYYMGFWLGDGDKGAARLSSTDMELKAYLQAYVDHLNAIRPPEEPVLCLRETVAHEAGDHKVLKTPSGSRILTANLDCFCWRVSSSGIGDDFWNPVWTGLKQMGFTGADKTVGIPDCYMNADEDTRLAVIAGLIESDGYRVNKFYRFTQNTNEHKKIVEDARKLALSCGILCSPLRQYDIKDQREPRYEFDMFKGCEKFQHHLIIPRKKLDSLNSGSHHINWDAHVFHVSDHQNGEFRAVEVSGCLYQLANRTVVHT